MTAADAMRIFIPATLTFLIGIAITPFVSHYLYKYKMWKPKAGKVSLDGTPAETFNTLHQTREVGTPRLGGVIVWLSVLICATVLSLLSHFLRQDFGLLAFISRNQTWVPLAAMIAGALVGLLDDLYEIEGKKGLRLRIRLGFVAVTSFLCAYWFYAKLGVSSIALPFIHSQLEVGIFFIPLFVLVALFIYAGGVIDGIDGLAGGIFASIFAAYAGIAFFQQQQDIAALSASISGGLLAFLWFNIPPARFYLSETGTMGLSLALVVIAFLTDSISGGKGVAVLPIIALPLVVTVLSNILQILSKKFLGRKLLRIAPLHHHFEAIGWPPYKVTMRYWIVSVLAAVIGITVALL